MYLQFQHVLPFSTFVSVSHLDLFHVNYHVGISGMRISHISVIFNKIVDSIIHWEINILQSCLWSYAGCRRDSWQSNFITGEFQTASVNPDSIIEQVKQWRCWNDLLLLVLQTVQCINIQSDFILDHMLFLPILLYAIFYDFGSCFTQSIIYTKILHFFLPLIYGRYLCMRWSQHANTRSEWFRWYQRQTCDMRKPNWSLYFVICKGSALPEYCYNLRLYIKLIYHPFCQYFV